MHGPAIASQEGAVPKPFSVIVPVYNEARGLAERAGALLAGLPEGCELIFVCNGCTDGSETILRRKVGGHARVLVTEQGKSRAIRLGEAHASLLPRFYVDSDVTIGGSDLARLSAALTDGVELVAPRIVFDLTGASWPARQLSTVWLSLPHARQGAFHHVLGVSASVRARWGDLPDVIADDAFMESMVASHEKRIVATATVTVMPPRRLWDWIRVRIRWQRGVDELRRSGIAPPPSPGQYRALVRAAMTPRGLVPASLYLASVLLARILARTSLLDPDTWYHDPTSR